MDAGGNQTIVPDAGAPNDAGSDAAQDVEAPLTCVICLNAGGAAFTSAKTGRAFTADTGADSGETYDSMKPVDNTDDDALYQTERFGNAFNYTLTVPNGSYTLNLHFAEVYWSAQGERVFNVDVQGTRVLDNYDIVKDVGANTPVVKTFPVTVVNGQVTIGFTTVTDNAKISAIELLGR